MRKCLTTLKSNNEISPWLADDLDQAIATRGRTSKRNAITAYVESAIADMKAELEDIYDDVEVDARDPLLGHVEDAGEMAARFSLPRLTEAELITRGDRVLTYATKVLNGTNMASKVNIGVLSKYAEEALRIDTGLPVDDAMEVIVANAVVHSIKGHADLSDADWRNLPRVTNDFDEAALGKKDSNPSLRRVIVRKVMLDGTGYGAVLSFASGQPHQRLNLVSFFKGRGKSLDHWWKNNKGFNSASVPNLTEPSSNDPSGPSKPLSKTVAPDGNEVKESTTRLSDDLAAQQQFLTAKAKDAGYADIDDYASNDIAGFVKAAEDWREREPAEVLESPKREEPVQETPARSQLTGQQIQETAQRNSLGTLTADQEKALRNVGGITEPVSLKERIKDLMKINIRQGLVDQFAPIKDLDQRAYMLARLSKGGDGAIEATMLYGKAYIDGDTYNVKIDPEGGFAKALADLKGEHDRALWWVAAQRAKQIKQRAKEAEAKYQQALMEIKKFEGAKSEAQKNDDLQGYKQAQAILNQLREARDQLKGQAAVDERLFSDADITSLEKLNEGKFPDGSSRALAFAKFLKTLNEYNNSVLEIAQQSGLIDQAAVDIFRDQPYVPFYRVMDDGDMPAGRMSGGMLNQRAWKKMKGGSEKLNEDLLANMLMNWSHIYTAAARNRASVATLAKAKKMGAATEVPVGTKGAAKVMVNGKQKAYALDDPYLVEALAALEWAMPSWMRPLATFKRMFTWGVTVSPFFKVKNLIRDSISAIGQSDLDPNVLKNLKIGWSGTDKNSQVFASMLAGGGVIRFGTSVEDNRAAHARRTIEKIEDHILDKSGMAKLGHQMRDIYDWYQEQGDRSENINRAALYQKLVEKGYTHAEASFMSRDLLDFSMSGRWPVVRFLAQTVPFLNARLQGLYKLGRAGHQNPHRLAATVGTVILASLALFALADWGDDDDWKAREDWDRDVYWWFKIGGTAFRIPKPFEIGAIGTMAERTAEMFFSKERDKGARYLESISRALFQTFSFDPTPVLVKPLIEIDSNKDSFTKRPIENMSMQRMAPEDRATPNTTQLAVALGQLGVPNPFALIKGDWKAMSPVQVDHLIKGYLGWAGGVGTGMADILLRPATGAGEKPAKDWLDFSTGKMIDEIGKADSNRYLSAYYEAMRQTGELKASYDAARKVGDKERADEIKEDSKDDLRRNKLLQIRENRIGYLTRQARKIAADKDMPGEEKRVKIDKLNAERARLAEQAVLQ